MNLKLKKSILTMTTVLALSLAIVGCDRQNTNPPAPGTSRNNTTGTTTGNEAADAGQPSLDGTTPYRSNITQNDVRGTDLMGLNPDGTTVQDDGTIPQNNNARLNPSNPNTGFNTNDRLNTSIENNQNITGRNEGFQNSTVRDDYDNNNSFQRAERIERAVNSVVGVTGAKVLVSNNRALVGIDMPARTTGNDTTTMRSNVERAVKNADPNITRVAVSADPDIFRRITNVGNGIRGGRPLSQFGAEIEEIFNRVIPR